MEKLNRREFLKKAGALAVTVGVAPIVSACTNTTATPTTAPVAPTAGATAVPATKAVVATAVPEIGGDLYYLNWFTGDWPQKMKTEVAQAYPKLNLNIQNGMGVSEYLQAQSARFLAGAGVMDATELRPESIAGYVKAGYLADLTDLVKDFRGNYLDGAFKNCEFDGRTYCIPSQIAAVGMWYNKKMFADRGLSVPKTWDELINVCETFKKAGIYAFADSGVDAWILEQTVYPFIHKVFVDDPGIFSKIAAGTAKYTDPVWVDCFKQIDAFYKAGYIDPNSLGYDVTTYNSQFISGKVPMMNNGSYLGARVKTAPNLNDIGVFPWPLPGTSKFVVPSSVIMMFAINKSSNKKAEALALAKWFADPKTGGLFWTKDRGSSPVVKGATFEDPIVKMWAPLYDLPRLDMWHVVQGSAANAELLKSLALLWSKKITPEQIATNLQKAQAEQK